MIPQEKSKGHKWTNISLIIITVGILIYVAYSKGIRLDGMGKNVVLQTSTELLKLEEKEKTFIGVNGKQIFKVTTDGISAYDFDKTEVWSDTFSINNFEVKQKGSYIATAGKNGKKLVLFDTKGRVCEITTANPIVYFSINEMGGIVSIESGDNSYTISAYDKAGKYLCGRTSFTSTDGYPTAAILSLDNKLLIMSYVSVDDPQVSSSILAMDVRENTAESRDNIAFGYIENNNLVYALEYMSKDTWVCIGDKTITWHDNQGKTKDKQSDLLLVFVPELIKISNFGSGYFPIIYSEKPTQSVVHRQDMLAYYNEEGKQEYLLSLDGGTQSFYADNQGVIINVNGTFKGFNKLCNQVFEYTPTIDISKVIYVPSMKKGIAVSKDKVFLLEPKKESK